MTVPFYEVFAIRYATVDRRAADNFLAKDVHDGPMPMDYFVWALKGSDGSAFVVDTGFNAAAAEKRRRHFLCCPTAGLEAIGLERHAVRDVVITHLHYDHAGNLDLFPNATFHLQDAEMAYATGRHMAHGIFNHAYEIEDVLLMVRRVYAGRVRFHCGDADLAPGISLHRIGGHTDGLQAVRVHTERGWVVLASDASHYYANMRQKSPFPIVHDIGAMMEGYRRLEALASSPDHIVPGHDPAVLRLYPRFENAMTEIACLHLPSADGPDEPRR
jgi:glyoxylase-like metal-dependent hydrolase (beta-lactamase superfamily II)